MRPLPVCRLSMIPIRIFSSSLENAPYKMLRTLRTFRRLWGEHSLELGTSLKTRGNCFWRKAMLGAREELLGAIAAEIQVSA